MISQYEFDTSDTSYPVMVWGMGGSGKSAITMQLANGFFWSDYDPTIQDIYKCTLAIGDQNVRLDILDTAGDDDLDPFFDNYIKKEDGFVIVYAIDDFSSFDLVDSFIHRIIKKKKKNKKVKFQLLFVEINATLKNRAK
ncbi:Ras GTPase [Histomonas meleagridis]|uniref:Ras GTPase n=1 Tax=Histomonas meleagridis TaxID=135588 RepID=UPI003559C071|nr:Ras GTPase [Histomonas meleagridis]KAH0805522.1 Ras GTPase [Histomonas meleagridis]